MSEWPILSTVTFLPLVGALLVLVIRGDDAIARRNIFNVALWTTTVTFVLSIFIWINFDTSDPGFQLVEQTDWLGGCITYKMGVDGISMLFVILTTFLMPLCILASRLTIERHFKEYMVAFLVLETLMIGVFCALDLVLFYVFFEGGLIPMFLIIGIWGGPRRVYASFKFFLYTLLGSVLMLLAIMAMYWEAGTTDIPALLAHTFPASMQTWLWIAFFASLRREDADVAGAHLAARRPCRGADRGLGDPRRASSSRWAATASSASRCRCSRSPRPTSRRWSSCCR